MANNKKDIILPFRILGNSKDSMFYFLIEDTGIIFTLKPTQMTKKNFYNMAPLSWWEENFGIWRKSKDSDEYYCTGINEDVAADYLIQESKKIQFSIKKCRGAGIWNDEGRIVYNIGNGTLYELSTTEDGKTELVKYKYKEFETDFYYIISDRDFPEPEIIREKMASNIDGQKLEKLFIAQELKSEFEAKILMGWTLIAPFGTILKWRPHIWLSGVKGIGKSWMYENLIALLGCGSEYCTASGTTPAALRRALGENGGYAVIDEMDSRNQKLKDRIDEIIELVKNASNDSASESSLVLNGKTELFKVSQMFCLVAIIPVLDGSAIESRVLNIEMKSKISMNEKIHATHEILKDGFFDDKEKFFNRTFFLLHRILESTQLIHSEIKKRTNDARKADNIAPCLAAWHHSKNVYVIQKEEIENIVNEYIEYSGMKEISDDDHDSFFRVLFNGQIRVDGEDINVSSLIIRTEPEINRMALAKIGIKIKGNMNINTQNKAVYVDKDSKMYISTKSQYIKNIMVKAGTYFGFNYNAVVKEHPAFIRGVTKRIIDAVYCHEMDLKKIAEMYYVGEGYVLKEGVPF